MIAVLLALLGVTAILAGVIHYGMQVSAGTNESPVRVGLGLLAGLLLSVAALAVGGSRLVVSILAAVTWLSAAILLFLHGQRRVPLSGIQVTLGDRIPAFEALTPEGGTFRSETLAGERYLLKFFRGQWCPFCQAELKRFDEMAPALQRRGVRVLAISKDTPEAATQQRQRDGLELSLLCDPDMKVICQFGLEHKKALEISGGPRIQLFGLSVGTRPVFRHMAAPTTLLVDEHGRIRWIDQTDDYKLRSQPERVLHVIEAVFGDEVPHAPAPTKRRPIDTRAPALQLQPLRPVPPHSNPAKKS